MHHSSRKSFLVFALAFIVIVAVPAAWSQDGAKDFHWKGKLAPDQVIKIKGINGQIRAERATGDEVEVSAEISGTYADEVKIQVIQEADGVTICEVYRSHDSCTGHSSDRNNDHTRVNYSVRVPATVRFTGVTVNGSVTAENLDRQVKAASINGAVRVSTKSWAEATSVNGSVEVKMGSADWTGALRISTVNGSIRVSLPTGANAEVSIHSLNGRFSSELPVTTQEVSYGRISGRIGNGGRELNLRTVNGSVELMKSAI